MVENNQYLAQQNNLLMNQNKLLIQMNDLMMRQISESHSDEVFIENIDRDEMRSGFLVTSHRKKLWNVQIGLIKEIERICKKHNIKWFAFYGTLLGAARHKGFIPWDDDLDIVMIRPEYEKFTKIAAEEIKYPYFFDAWYNHKFESEGASESINDGLQLVKTDQEQKIYQRIVEWPCWPTLKIRDCRTSQIMWMERKHINQGIFIDVFPLDPVPPFDDKKDEAHFAVVRELYMATNYPRIIKKALENNQKTFIERGELEKFISLPFRQRALQYEKLMAKNFFASRYIGSIRYHFVNRPICCECSAFEKTVYLPFEKIELPVPINYDNVLKSIYGDWHKLIFTHAHSSDWSVDIPYTEYYQKSAFAR